MCWWWARFALTPESAQELYGFSINSWRNLSNPWDGLAARGQVSAGRGNYGHINAMGGHCRGVAGIGIGGGPGPSATALGSAFGLSKVCAWSVADTQVPPRGRQCGPRVRTVSHLYLNSDCCIDRHFCIVGNMKRLASLAAMTVLAAGGFGVAHATNKRGAFGVFALSVGGETQVANTKTQ